MCRHNLRDDRILSVKEKYIYYLKVDHRTTSCKPRDSSQAHIHPSAAYTHWPDFHTNMLVASTVTTLADVDLTLGGDMDLGSQICIWVTTQGETTLLCSTSFKEGVCSSDV